MYDRQIPKREQNLTTGKISYRLFKSRTFKMLYLFFFPTFKVCLLFVLLGDSEKNFYLVLYLLVLASFPFRDWTMSPSTTKISMLKLYSQYLKMLTVCGHRTLKRQQVKYGHTGGPNNWCLFKKGKLGPRHTLREGEDTSQQAREILRRNQTC